jgi:hypothetical protein
MSHVSLKPLSSLFATIFDELSIEDRVNCLHILGNSMENYSPLFIQKVYNEYSNEFVCE